MRGCVVSRRLDGLRLSYPPQEISRFGILVKPQLNVGVAKSIYSAEQVKLQSLLRQVRAEAKLTQVGLAERLGKPQSFVSKYESGERRLDLVELRSVCRCLGITLRKFVGRFESSIGRVKPH